MGHVCPNVSNQVSIFQMTAEKSETARAGDVKPLTNRGLMRVNRILPKSTWKIIFIT